MPCNATDARENTPGLMPGAVQFVPVVENASQRFHVVYSAKVDEPGGPVTNTAVMSVFELGGSAVLLFGCGYGDGEWLTEPGHGPWQSAIYDAGLIDHVIRECLYLGDTPIFVVAPHSHPTNPSLVAALRALGHGIAAIAYHVGDAEAIGTMAWTPDDREVFVPLDAGSCKPCRVGGDIYQFATTCGVLRFLSRPGHTPGCIDGLLQVSGPPNTCRFVIEGSGPPPIGGAYCPIENEAVAKVALHENVLLEGTCS